MISRIGSALLAAALALVLAACGGGSNDAVAPPVDPACGAGALPSGAIDTTLAVAGYPDRNYDLLLPASYVCGQPVAVLIVLHGGGGNKDNMRRTVCPGGDLTSAGCLYNQALAAGMAVVLPNGTDGALGVGLRTWNAGGGQNGYVCVSDGACQNNVDDVAYIRAVVADLRSRAVVDGKRVFATGFSNGAALTHRLACQAADLIAAIASVSGENQFAQASACTPARPVAVLDIHGTLDTCWPYAGGNSGCLEAGLYVSVDSTLADWRARNGCGATTTAALSPLPGVNDGTSVVRETSAGCTAEGAVEHMEIIGGGHYWPRGFNVLDVIQQSGVLSQQLDASQAIVAFLAASGRR